MKNKPKIIKILTILIFICQTSFSSDIIIEAEKVDVKNKGNSIIASGSVNIKDGDILKITSDQAQYDKINKILEVNGNIIMHDVQKNYRIISEKVIFDRNNKIINSFGNSSFIFLDKNNEDINFKVSGENSIFNQNKKILEIENNVILEDLLNDYTIYSDKIIYDIKKDIIKSVDKTKINYKDNLLVNTRDIFFNKGLKIFRSNKNTEIIDIDNNKFEISNFEFNLENKIFKGKKIKVYDKDNNILEFENGLVNLNSNELIGSDFNFNFNKNSFGNPENDPRLIGRYVITNKSSTTMKKSTFTTCKKIDGKCPAWSISANEVIHLKEKKRIDYKNAWLKIYDIPVAYFPYFFHPDPSVKRQSGFLFPQFINSSNLGFSTQIPYFYAIAPDKDMTISPRVYSNNNLFVQSEYRQEFANSNLITDFSYNKKDGSNAHFFGTLKGDFEQSFYEMKFETVSNRKYLKKYQIQSPIINDYSTLNSSLIYEKFTENYNFSTSFSVIEDLSKNRSDSFEFIMPSYNFETEKEVKNSFFNTINFNSTGSYNKFNTNIDEADIVNDLLLSSNNKNQEIKNLNIELNLLLKNTNTYGDLSPIYKDDTDHKFVGSLIYDIKYPLIKKTNTGTSFLTPRASIRFSPSGTYNLRDEKMILTYQDLFSINRINKKSIEDGSSATLGLEYDVKNEINNDKLKLGIGINFRNKIDNDLPLSTSLGQKTSDLIGYSGINITENLAINYNFSIDQNLSETNYSLISANYNASKLNTRFEYMEKSKFVGDESYLNNYTQLKLDKSNSIAFETNRNIDKNLTNYFNLIYEYQNDCLRASVVYNKQFYQDEDVNPGKNIFFKISFIPFGTVNSPNIND